MIAFSYYLLKIIICSAVLFGYYWVGLRNKIFHGYNRFYLLAIVVLSLTLPLCRINIFQEKHIPQTSVIKMLQVVTAGDEYIDEVIITAPQKPDFSFIDILPFLYLLISMVLFAMLMQMLLSIFVLSKNNKAVKIEQIHFINTDAAKGTPFSFFKYIFWNKQIDMHSPTGSRIFKHELAHIQEGHSWDKIFINLVLIVCWINPVFWLIRRELGMIHEFIADKHAVEDGDTTAFASMILAATYPQHNIAITNNFFYSPIKRRLMMLTKNQHPSVNYFSRLLVLPLLVIVFAAFTIKAKEYKEKKIVMNNSITKTLLNDNISQAGIKSSELMNETNIEKKNTAQNVSTDKQIIVVLDAGHGGTDPGAKSPNGVYEKDMTLLLVKKIVELNKNNNIKIILTRETDLTQDVREKANFVKTANADLFISIHMDYQINKKEKISKDGLNVYISNDTIQNNEKSRLFASAVIGSFKNNYYLDVKPFPQQRKQGIYVLRANNIPSILLEAGCVNIKKDLDYLQSEIGQETFANNVLNAINTFANNITQDDISRANVQKRVAGMINSTDELGAIDASQRKEYKNGRNAITFTSKDSNDIVFLFKGKIISNKQAMEMLTRDSIDVKVYDATRAFEKFGIKSNNGVIDIVKREIIEIDPVFKLDNKSGGRIKVEDFLKLTEAKVTHGFEIVSANVYFGGEGFPLVKAANLYSNKLDSIKELMKKCVAGTAIAFTNIKVKNKDGMRTIEEKAFTLY